MVTEKKAWRAVSSLAFVLLMLGLAGGCGGLPQYDGLYLNEGPIEDVGVIVATKYLPGPPHSDPIPTNQVEVSVEVFPHGEWFPTKIFKGTGAYGPLGAFTAAAVDQADPADTVQVTGRPDDLNKDGSAEQLTGDFVFSDGTRHLVLLPAGVSGAPGTALYDYYKCWDNECGPAVGPPTCTLTPSGGNFALHADVPFKDGAGDLNGGFARWSYRNFMCEVPLPGSGSGCFASLVTAAFTGTTLGTVTYDMSDQQVLSWPFEAAFYVADSNGDTNDSNIVSCVVAGP